MRALRGAYAGGRVALPLYPRGLARWMRQHRARAPPDRPNSPGRADVPHRGTHDNLLWHVFNFLRFAPQCAACVSRGQGPAHRRVMDPVMSPDCARRGTCFPPRRDRCHRIGMLGRDTVAQKRFRKESPPLDRRRVNRIHLHRLSIAAASEASEPADDPHRRGIVVVAVRIPAVATESVGSAGDGTTDRGSARPPLAPDRTTRVTAAPPGRRRGRDNDGASSIFATRLSTYPRVESHRDRGELALAHLERDWIGGGHGCGRHVRRSHCVGAWSQRNPEVPVGVGIRAGDNFA